MNYFRKDHTADCKTYCVVFFLCQATRDLTLQTTEIDPLLVKEKTTVLLHHGFKLKL